MNSFCVAAADIVVINTFTQYVGNYSTGNYAMIKELFIMMVASGTVMPKKGLLFLLRNFNSVRENRKSCEDKVRFMVQQEWDKVKKLSKVFEGKKLEDVFELGFYTVAHQDYDTEKYMKNAQEFRTEIFNLKEILLFAQDSRISLADQLNLKMPQIWEGLNQVHLDYLKLKSKVQQEQESEKLKNQEKIMLLYQENTKPPKKKPVPSNQVTDKNKQSKLDLLWSFILPLIFSWGLVELVQYSIKKTGHLFYKSQTFRLIYVGSLTLAVKYSGIFHNIQK
jgi:hypothetical protein